MAKTKSTLLYNSSMYERVKENQGRGSEYFKPNFSSDLRTYSSKLSSALAVTKESYKNERKKFGGKPFPWE